MDYIKKIIESWNKTDNCINSNSEIFKWIQDLNKATEIEIKESTIINDTFWFYDDYRGEILNRRRSFFSILVCESLSMVVLFRNNLLLYNLK